MRALHDTVWMMFFVVAGCTVHAEERDTGPVRSDAPPPEIDAACVGGERACGASCCGAGEVCMHRGAECCATASVCGDGCCGTGEVCEAAICHLECGALERCGSVGAEVCCGDDEVCSSRGCFRPTVACTDFFDCGPDEICEPVLRHCVPRPDTEVCVVSTTGGEVRPTELWHWDGVGRVAPTSNQVMMTPIVVYFRDEGPDEHVPDVAFVTFEGTDYVRRGVLRVVSGDDGRAILDVTDVEFNPIAQLAAADLDGDHDVEIVGCALRVGTETFAEGTLVAIDATGARQWVARAPAVPCMASAPSIADLDADGTPEVVVRYTVVDGTTGAVEWSHPCVSAAGRSDDWMCNVTSVADLDLDGSLDVVGGAVAYRADGSALWDRQAELADGMTAVGDLDLDGSPEIVSVQATFTHDAYLYDGDHFLYVLDGRTGATRVGPIDVNVGRAPPLGTPRIGHAGGGPPTIANFDDDPQPEIALAGAYAYVVFDADGSQVWSAATHDASSRRTGSSVFDFDGDGISEAVYNDEYWLRVYDGRTGAPRFCACNTTGTLLEYPVIADVDDDGHAEIVVAANDYAWDDCPVDVDVDACTGAEIDRGANHGGHGVRVFAAPERDWMPTRRIWNQHTYHVTNVTELGEIPEHERPHWTIPGLDAFRRNTQPDGVFAPDLAVTELAVGVDACPSRVTVYFRVMNRGWGAARAGVYIDVFGRFDTMPETRLERVATTRTLLAGQSETFAIEVPLAAGLDDRPLHFRAVIDGGGRSDCVATNDEAATETTCGFLF